MKSIIAACAVVSAMSAGCAPDHGLTYHILIDTSLSPTQVEDVMAGGDAWSKAVPGLALDYTITPCQGYGSWQHTVCIFLDTGNPPSETIDGTLYQVLAKTSWEHGFLASPTSTDADSATIHVYTQVLQSQSETYTFLNMATHELGHAFTHNSLHIGSGNLMYAEEDGKVVEDITSDDIAYFWAAR